MNVLITGGAGYIGTELVYALEADQQVENIIIYDNLIRKNHNLFIGRSKLNTNKVKFIHGDILDSRKLKNEVQKSDIVFHLAAKVTTPFADHNPHEFDQINNWGTAELTYLVEESNVQKFIYISSASVYGSSKNEVDLNSNPNPKTFYGISKLHGEGHVKRLNYSRKKVYILRLGNVYGYSKSMRFDSVINKFIFEANFYNRIKIFGDGNQQRSFIHIDRLTSILKDIASSHFEPNTYDLVENNFSVNDIVDVIRELYPKLEMTFINQNMNMRSLKVKSDYRIPSLTDINKDILKSDLESFKSNFSF